MEGNRRGPIRSNSGQCLTTKQRSGERNARCISIFDKVLSHEMILAVEKLETIRWRVGFLNCLSYQISDALTCLSVFGVRFNDYGATHSQGTYGVGSYDGYGKGEVAGTMTTTGPTGIISVVIADLGNGLRSGSAFSSSVLSIAPFQQSQQTTRFPKWFGKFHTQSSLAQCRFSFRRLKGIFLPLLHFFCNLFKQV